jgi:ankyrin repeat protein
MKEQELINSVKTANLLELEALIKEGVDLNITDKDKKSIGYSWTLLHYCIFRGGTSQNKKYNEVAELLLKNGCKKNILNNNNENSVEFAIKFFALDILDLLIKNGAKINETENNIYDIILNRYYADQELDENHIEDIESDEEKELINKGEGEALQRMFQRIDIVVKNGYDLNKAKFSAAFCTILEIKSNQLPAKVLLYLFEKGANPLECLNPNTDNEYSLFDQACFENLPNQVLIDFANLIGIETTIKEEPDYTPLVIAINNNNLNLTQELIKLGANIHHNNDFPLISACFFGHFEIVKCLVENGAFINVIDEEGESPFQIAEKGGFKEIVDYLKTKL